MTSEPIDVRDGLPQIRFQDNDSQIKIGHFFGKSQFKSADDGASVTMYIIIAPNGKSVYRDPRTCTFIFNRLDNVAPLEPVDNFDIPED